MAQQDRDVYLVLVDLQDILPVLFSRVLIPGAVRRDSRRMQHLTRSGGGLAAGATWLETRPVSDVPVDLEQLGAGEREAIRLADVTETAVVLLDAKKARRIARDRGLDVSGTLGVLAFGARQGLLDLPAALDRLERTTFRASPHLLRLVRERHAAGWS